MSPNTYFVPEDDLQYLPPYFKNTGETRQPVNCKTEGDWPKWLRGTFIRMGCATMTIPLSDDGSKPNAQLQHFFDGLASLHKFEFADGQVKYSSRCTADGVIRNAKKSGYLQTLTFGVNPNTPLRDAKDPCWERLGRQQALYLPSGHLEPDAFNINVVPRRGIHIPPDGNPKSRGSPAANPAEEEIIVGHDLNILQICDAKTLEPKRIFTWAAIDPELAGYGICAHPPKDRSRGHFYNYLISEDGVLYVFAVDYNSNPARLVWKTALPCKPCYIHSLAMSQKYCVFIRNPVFMDTSDVSKPVSQMIRLEPESKTYFYVVDKDSGTLTATYAAPNFMFFHSVNGYDYRDEKTGLTNVHIDLCAYDGDAVPFGEYSYSNMLDPTGTFSNGTLVRYELSGTNDPHKAPDTVRRATAAQMIPDCPVELPRINKYYSCVPSYRYIWAVYDIGGPAPGTKVPIGRLSNGIKHASRAFLGAIAKTDWHTGKYLKWEPENGDSAPSEPVFIGRPGATDEDDGIVLTIVINREGTHSVLVALDGRTMKEVARAPMPQVYGMGPHATFIEAPGLYD